MAEDAARELPNLRSRTRCSSSSRHAERDDPTLASYLRIEERELEAGGLN